MKTFVRKNTWLFGCEKGWGNGYVIIPKGHRYHGEDYDNISVNVHGGLTFSEPVDDYMVKHWENINLEDIGGWCVGFDTAHHGDNPINWTKEAIISETERLRQQLEEESEENMPELYEYNNRD